MHGIVTPKSYIFSCTCNSMQGWYSLVNINPEYRSPSTQYHLCSAQDKNPSINEYAGSQALNTLSFERVPQPHAHSHQKDFWSMILNTFTELAYFIFIGLTSQLVTPWIHVRVLTFFRSSLVNMIIIPSPCIPIMHFDISSKEAVTYIWYIIIIIIIIIIITICVHG